MKLKDGTRPAFRVVHEDNLRLYLERGMLHAANHAPSDGLSWCATHNAQVQGRRASNVVPAGPGGTMLDYIPFHFGPRNLFLYNLHTGRVPGYTEGQEPLVTLVISVEDVVARGLGFVFYDGHALNALSTCYDDPVDLALLDWAAIHGTQFSNADPDLKRRKQAEIMIHRTLDWSLVRGIGV